MGKVNFAVIYGALLMNHRAIVLSYSHLFRSGFTVACVHLKNSSRNLSTESSSTYPLQGLLNSMMKIS